MAIGKGFGWARGIGTANNTLSATVGGVEVLQLAAATVTLPAGIGLTITDTGITATAGGITATAGDLKVTAGNVRLGAISTFGTTEPTSAIVFKVGTAPAGAITTSGGLFTDGTVMKKIIAAGTVSNIET